MYSNKDNVNILTALLVAHGIQHAVVCPGSRNAPITHNLVVCPDIDCYSVTDERSAGFYALGLSMATNSPVAACVTSGTALLNLLPAVAEAAYQHVPVIVVSADRPPQWIDQLDGQTLPQGDALGRFVRKAVTLPEPLGDEEHWYCNRLVNEALLATRQQGGGPVHINVPLTEPLYEFTVKSLPEERAIFMAPARNDKRLLQECAGNLLMSKRPMIVVGQTLKDDLLAEDFAVYQDIVVLNEALSIGCGACHFDELLSKGRIPPSMLPDFVLYLGGELVSKRMKQFLRQLPDDVKIWSVSKDGRVRDTFMSMHGLIEGHPADVLADLAELTKGLQLRSSLDFFEQWDDVLACVDEAIDSYDPDYSQMAAVKMLEAAMEFADEAVTHYGNSSAVRLANVFSSHFVYCNRGVNGIEGTLSTAAGFSLCHPDSVFCVVGDLSFFYDANALWPQCLKGNLRVLLLNNGGGGIFEKFEGLRKSPARDDFVMARHQTTAEGLCQSFNVDYRSAHNMEELEEGMEWLTETADGNRPLVLEVVTDSAADARVLRDFYAHIAETKF